MEFSANMTESVITFFAVPIKFGFGVMEEMGYEVKRFGARKVLLCTDRMVKKAGYPQKIKKIIEKENIGVDIYDDIHIEPTDRSIEKTVNDLQGNEYDLYLALGGGSTIDTTKIVNLLLTHPAPVLDYVNQPIGGGKPVPGPVKPMLAMPTTAGTGSETTTVAVLDLTELKMKSGISHAFLRPALACLDPVLTVSLPPEVTASTGMDALVHALESYTTKPFDKRRKPAHPGERTVYMGCNPFTDIWDERAIEFIGQYLRRAVADPYDLEARWHIMAAATFAGLGFGNTGVHIPHAMAYPLASLLHKYQPPGYPVTGPMTPHGQAVSVTAPAALRFTAPVWPERHALAAELLGAETGGLSAGEAASLLPGTIIELMKDIGFPSGIAALGYTEKDIPQIVEGTLKQQRLLSGCPRRAGEKELTRVALESMNNW